MEHNNNMHIRAQLQRAAGLDMHKNKVSACYYIEGEKEVARDYGTFTCELVQIRDDLLAQQIEHVIMESTGVYWIALCALLTASGIKVHVVNARFVKNMPKEKTDKKDARWLCKILVNGLVRNSFVVSEQQLAFRDLCRMRIKYTQHITQSQNRIVKNLERRNIKLRSVVSSMDTVSAMAIVGAIAQGETDIEKLVSLCKTKLKKKIPEMRKALVGIITNDDRLMFQRLLDDIAHYRKQILSIETQISEHTNRMNGELVANLKEVKGIGRQSTEIILAEVGDNVDAFSTADKLTAWVGLAPGNKESAGKSFYAGTRDGNVHLRTAMIQVAWAAVRTKNSYWRALYYHFSRRMQAKKAIVAIARKLMRVVYKIIKGTMKYREYGGEYFIEKLQQRKQQRTIIQPS